MPCPPFKAPKYHLGIFKLLFDSLDGAGPRHLRFILYADGVSNALTFSDSELVVLKQMIKRELTINSIKETKMSDGFKPKVLLETKNYRLIQVKEVDKEEGVKPENFTMEICSNISAMGDKAWSPLRVEDEWAFTLVHELGEHFLKEDTNE